ncbi:hypothetical protein GYMLUDRAFT_322731 [Collybiopsis luxurians FD-317 M1]|nr:hypothetical protein GYMLUDRAFT_322731 [Collybiopsis luxurians FD-317 M1]
MLRLPLPYHCARRKPFSSFSVFRIKTHIRQTRSFSHEKPPEDSKDASLSEEPVKPTKIKKSFSKLPKTHILPDGSIAKPLQDWQGGENTPLRSVDQGHAAAEDILSQVKAKQYLPEVAYGDDDAKSKPRRRKGIKADASK